MSDLADILRHLKVSHAQGCQVGLLTHGAASGGPPAGLICNIAAEDSGSHAHCLSFPHLISDGEQARATRPAPDSTLIFLLNLPAHRS